MHPLASLARQLVAPGKGILAADESTGTIGKRFRAIGLASTEETRRAYRELLCTAPGAGEFISGVILYDETLRQSAADGTPLVDVLRRQGIVAGIKVDRGAKPLANFPDEKITEGLDGLRDRLAEYARLGAGFTKWRAVITLGDGRPTQTAIEANAHALARFASLSQEAGLVPIVEPEVLMDGDHPLAEMLAATERAQAAVFRALGDHRVALEAMLLKPNMIVSGADTKPAAGAAEVATATLRCLRAHVPAAVPGIVFLSGGQSETEATTNLDAINRAAKVEGAAPWQLSFSFGRALQASALKTWAGRPENVSAAQAAFLHRARCNHAARRGDYRPEMEAETSSANRARG
jgi:fructose-bisphosphate aldolase class I